MKGNDIMTVDEFIKELKTLSNEGKGNYNIVDGDYGSDIAIQYINDNTQDVFV